MKQFVWTLLVLPVVPIGMAWAAFRRAPEATRARRLRLVLLLLVSMSQALLLAGSAWAAVLGPSYSTQRYATILVNIVTMAVATVLAVRVGGDERLPLVTSCAWVLSCWIYALVVNSAV